MQHRRIALALIVAGAAAFTACGDDGLLQGDSYRPDGRLPIAPASTRVDGGPCEGGSCDGGVTDAQPLPLQDASPPPTNTCATARAIGAISGDINATSITAQGTCSEWISLRAKEDSSSALGAAMKVKMTLTPTGGNFDMFVFYDPVRDVVSCTTPFASSTATGADTLSLTWGEGNVANGSDDSRTIGIAVVKTGGPCGPDAGTWTFLAEGNR